MAPTSSTETLTTLAMEGESESRWINLMEKLIGESEHVQNNPPRFVPEEDKVIQHLLAQLMPHSVENGGPLIVKHIHYKEKRGNLIIQYNSANSNKDTRTLGFVGSHLDVVPANPESWERNPFKMTHEGDKLYGRGTTDCLGHVALITELFTRLAEEKPILSIDVWGVFIASEENSSIKEVGVDMLDKHGELEHLKNGPILWIDSADSQPCIGTAGAIPWHLKATGRLFHSGLPHKAINPLEMAMEALSIIQKRFYEDFPPHERETLYNFQAASSMKPTQWKVSEGSINQIPAHCTISGDIRLTPFYKVADAIAAVKKYVKEINCGIMDLPTRGPNAKYALFEEECKMKGILSVELEDEPFRGIACHLDSPGYKALCQATESVLGFVKPYSICGSLPLVRDMQDAGYDVQVCGYGLSSVYHGDNEYCEVSSMKNAFRILSNVIATINANSSK